MFRLIIHRGKINEYRAFARILFTVFCGGKSIGFNMDVVITCFYVVLLFCEVGLYGLNYIHESLLHFALGYVLWKYSIFIQFIGGDFSFFLPCKKNNKPGFFSLIKIKNIVPLKNTECLILNGISVHQAFKQGFA